jgi:hypothetical protein
MLEIPENLRAKNCIGLHNYFNGWIGRVGWAGWVYFALLILIA